MTNSENDTGAGNTRKTAAMPGKVIESRPVAAGDPAGATAKGGDITPADSNLLGQPQGQPRPAAAKKPGADQKDQTGDKPLRLTQPAAAGGAAKPGKADPEVAQSGIPKTSRPEVAKAEPAKAESTKPEPAKPEPAKPAPAPVPVTVQRRGGFWPLAFGGAVAAGLGAAATIWALPHLPPGWLPEQPVEVVEQGSGITLDDVRGEISTALETLTPPDAPDLSALETRLDEIEGNVAQTGEQARQAGETAAQEAIAALTLPDEGASPQAVAALAQQVQQQAAQIAELAARPALDPALAERMQALVAQGETLEAQLAAAAADAESRIADAQSEAERLQQAAAESTRRAEALAAIASLQTALDQGVSTDAAAEQLRSAGVEPPAAVTAGAPTLAALQADYPAAARAALRAALREDASDGGALGAVGNFLRVQTGARSVTPRDGDDPDAVLSRAGAAVDAGNIGAALSEIGTLPETARNVAPMAEWLAGAQAWQAAHDALSELSGQSN
ncbi:MAG: hypothetical protein Q4G14_09040 [Paracoccus sp. (in: a-proteobacteria)]|uniref:COG4223 family protein n=1 Tax=Paracoccus sp. TaxID=267 RepID=UPI0026E0C4E0|nr:hypothetical protein [Paracoccus sp. (in: a-proteobacteria)]MDO5613370.1 hypothetical protein [Paracoccus sp. (in: a-proteobacteria)]